MFRPLRVPGGRSPGSEHQRWQWGGVLGLSQLANFRANIQGRETLAAREKGDYTETYLAEASKVSTSCWNMHTATSFLRSDYFNQLSWVLLPCETQPINYSSGLKRRVFKLFCLNEKDPLSHRSVHKSLLCKSTRAGVLRAGEGVGPRPWSAGLSPQSPRVGSKAQKPYRWRPFYLKTMPTHSDHYQSRLST